MSASQYNFNLIPNDSQTNPGITILRLNKLLFDIVLSYIMKKNRVSND